MSAPTTEEHRAICRTCENLCAVVVTIEDGQVVHVAGDHANPLHRGYVCAEARAQQELYGSPDRLRTSAARGPDGRYGALTPDAAIRAIARQLTALRDESGSGSIAVFQGPYAALDHPASLAMVDAFLRALGSPVLLRPPAFDRSGLAAARAAHGRWMAPGLGARDPDAVLVVGADPLTGHGAWAGDPDDFVGDDDVSLVVIDPCRTETARRADVHLRARPGHEAAVLAAMLGIIFDQGLEDAEFLADHVTGVAELRAAVARFDPATVAAAAGVQVGDLQRAALLFGEADRAYAVAGPGSPTLPEYLLLAIQTVCGYWSRAGDPVPNAPTLLPAQASTAQAMSPFPAEGERARGRDGVRALLALGGDPGTGGLDSLDLLVQTDVTMSGAAQRADYVIGLKLPYELPGTTIVVDVLAGFAEHLGMRRSYAQYAAPVLRPAAHVLDHPEFLFRLAQRMGLQLEVHPGPGSALPGGAPVPLDMDHDLDHDLLFELAHRGSRVPLQDVMARSGGAFFPEPAVTVAPREDGWEGRLDVGNGELLAELQPDREAVAAGQ